ncbi:hypothetical protein [Staphylococcus aureus]
MPTTFGGEPKEIRFL